MDINTLVVAAAIVLGLPGLIGAAHLGLLAVASWFYREPRPAQTTRGPVPRARPRA